MQYGYFSVKSVLDYVAPYPELPPRGGIVQRGYINTYNSLLSDVPKIAGWYAWLKLENSDVSFIYIGKSSKRRTSNIHARLREEFLDDRVLFWGMCHQHILDTDWSDHKYFNNIQRALKMVGVTHIAWFGSAGLTDEEVVSVEGFLIQKYSPTANSIIPAFNDNDIELANEAANTLEQIVRQIEPA